MDMTRAKVSLVQRYRTGNLHIRLDWPNIYREFIVPVEGDAMQKVHVGRSDSTAWRKVSAGMTQRLREVVPFDII
jgi:hypothetical protein